MVDNYRSEMRTIVILRMTAVFLLAAIILAGCSAKPVLISKSAGVPTGVDLSGRWTLRAGPVPISRPIVTASRNFAYPEKKTSTDHPGRARGERRGHPCNYSSRVAPR